MGILSNISTTCIRTSDGRREQTTPCRRRSHFCLVPINKCLFSPAPSDQRRGTAVRNTSTWAFRRLSEIRNTSTWAFRHLSEVRNTSTWAFRRLSEIRNTSTWAFRHLSEVRNTSIWAFRHLAEIKIDHNGDLIKGLQMC